MSPAPGELYRPYGQRGLVRPEAGVGVGLRCVQQPRQREPLQVQGAVGAPQAEGSLHTGKVHTSRSSSHIEVEFTHAGKVEGKEHRWEPSHTCTDYSRLILVRHSYLYAGKVEEHG